MVDSRRVAGDKSRVSVIASDGQNGFPICSYFHSNSRYLAAFLQYATEPASCNWFFDSYSRSNNITNGIQHVRALLF